MARAEPLWSNSLMPSWTTVVKARAIGKGGRLLSIGVDGSNTDVAPRFACRRNSTKRFRDVAWLVGTGESVMGSDDNHERNQKSREDWRGAASSSRVEGRDGEFAYREASIAIRRGRTSQSTSVPRRDEEVAARNRETLRRRAVRGGLRRVHHGRSEPGRHTVRASYKSAPSSLSPISRRSSTAQTRTSRVWLAMQRERRSLLVDRG